MGKLALAVLVLVLVFGGYFYSQRGVPRMQEDDLKNVTMLEREGGYAVATSSVNYFEDVFGLYAEPMEKGNYPGVVMIHENRGLRPEIRMTAEQLASEGYRVLAVDLYNGRTAETQEEARTIADVVSEEKRIENLRAAAQYLRGKGASKVASLGWCFGGRQSVALAISGEPLDATVIYYGGGMATTTEQLAPIEWPVLGIFGDQDRVISVETVQAFENSLKTLGIENEIYIYPGVGHAFANPSGDNYAPEETKDAWAKTLRFLEKHLR